MSFLYKSLQWRNQCYALLPYWQLPIWTCTSNYLLSPKCPRTQVRTDYFWNVYNRLTATAKTNSLSCNELKSQAMRVCLEELLGHIWTSALLQMLRRQWALLWEGRKKEASEGMSFQKPRKAASGTNQKPRVVWSASQIYNVARGKKIFKGSDCIRPQLWLSCTQSMGQWNEAVCL